jgi:hypothetical protein
LNSALQTFIGKIEGIIDKHVIAENSFVSFCCFLLFTAVGFP